MRNAELHIEKLKETFGDKDYFQVSELHAFYQSIDSTVAKSKVNWRINSLVKTGAIQRIGRGTYKLGSSRTYSPQISMKMFKLNNLMKSNFPYLGYIIWHISETNFLLQHLINKDVSYVEVEREAVDAVFERLREKFKYVFKGKSNEELYFGESVIVVRTLVTGSPTQFVRNVPTTTIEKLLVDLFSDKEFEFLRGNELTHIFNNAFSKYTVNLDRLHRYASRKGKRTVIADYINAIK